MADGRLSNLAAVATPGRVRIVLAIALTAVFVLLQLRPAGLPPPANTLAWEHDGRLYSSIRIVRIAMTPSSSSRVGPS
jgi:hypothetical protein